MYYFIGGCVGLCVMFVGMLIANKEYEVRQNQKRFEQDLDKIKDLGYGPKVEKDITPPKEKFNNLPARYRYRMEDCTLCLKNRGDELCDNCKSGVIAGSITKRHYCECEQVNCAMCNP